MKHHRRSNNINTKKNFIFPDCSTTSLFSPEEWENLGSEFPDWTKEVEIEAGNPLQSDSYQEIRGSSDEFFSDRKRKSQFQSQSQAQGNFNNDDEMNSIYSGSTGLFSDWELRKLGLEFPDSFPSEWPDNNPADDGRRLPKGLTAVTEKPPRLRTGPINLQQKKESAFPERVFRMTEKLGNQLGKYLRNCVHGGNSYPSNRLGITLIERMEMEKGKEPEDKQKT